MTDGPLIVQSDKTLLLEVDHDQAEACRRAIAPFAEKKHSKKKKIEDSIKVPTEESEA